jgi:hypothetical protein
MTSLSGALPETVAAYDALDQYARSVGIGIALADFGGLRTLSDTTRILGYRQQDFDAAVAAGQVSADTTLNQFRPIAPFGSSYHNYGAAFDITIQSRPASMTTDQALRTLASYAPSIGLRWGGTFRNPDPPHFELAITLAAAQAKYKSYLTSGGGASSLSFDLSSFLPGLTSGPDDTQAALDTPQQPDTSDLYDESGDTSVAELSSGPPLTLIAIGLAVAGFLTFLIRRKFK